MCPDRHRRVIVAASEVLDTQIGEAWGSGSEALHGITPTTFQLHAAARWDLAIVEYALGDARLPSSRFRILRDGMPDLPVIAVSTDCAEEAIVEALGAGAADYVSSARLTRLRASAEEILQASPHPPPAPERDPRQPLEHLLAVSRAMLAETTVEGLLQRAVDGARALTGARMAAAGHGAQEGGFRVTCASHGDGLPCPPANTSPAETSLALALLTERGGVAMTLLSERATIRLAEDRRPGERGMLPGLLGARLVEMDGRPSGLIVVASGDEAGFATEDEDLLAQWAALVSLGLQQIEARRQAERWADELDGVFQSLTDGVVIYDPTGRPTRANPAAAQAFGFSAPGVDRTQAARQLRITHPDGRPAQVEELPSTRALRGEVVRDTPFTFTDATGRQVHILASAAPLRADGTPSGAYAVWHDVTALRRLMEENRRQRELLEAMFSASPVGIAAVRALDHTYEMANPAYRAIPGTPDTPVVGRTFAEVFPAVAAEGVTAMIDEAAATGRTVSVREYCANVGAGREETYWDVDQIPLREADGTCTRVLILARDATERVLQRNALEQRAHELAREGALLQAIIANAPEAIVVADREGRVLLTNPAADRLYARPVPYGEEYASHAALEVCYPDGRPVPSRDLPLTRSALDGETIHEVELAIHWPDGQYRSLLVNSAPIHSATGELDGAVGVFQDITERKRAQEALRESEARFRELADAMPQLVWTARPDGTVDYYNERYHEFAGITPRGEAWEWAPVLHPEDVEPTVEAWQRALATGTVYEIEHRVWRADGSCRWYLSRGVPAHDAEGRIHKWYGTATDIHATKLAEEAMRRYAERLRALHEVDEGILAARSAAEVARAVVENVPTLLPCRRASVVLHHLETREVSLLASYQPGGDGTLGTAWRGPADPAWGSVLEGLMRGEGYVVEDLQALPATSPMMAQLQKEGVRAQVYEPLMIRGEFMGTLSLGLDRPGPLSPEDREVMRELATQLAIALEQARLHEEVQRHAEELEELVRRRTASLEASEARFRAVFEDAALGIAMVDLQGQLLAVNPALERLSGFSASEMVGRSFAGYCAPGVDGGALLMRYQALLQSGASTGRLESRWLRADGQARLEQMTVSVVRDGAGTPRFAIVMIEDITEERQARAALVQAERLNVTGQLTAAFAHEIKNPLQAVIGCLGLLAEALEEECTISENAQRYLEVARSELHRADRIVNRLREFHRRGSETPVLASLPDIIEHIRLITQKQCEHQVVTVRVDMPQEAPSVLARPDELRQVFLNLVLNALDAMPNGGTLRIAAETTTDPLGVRVVVSDDGEGIPPEALPHVFEFLYTTKEQGTGLGLFVCQEIARTHGGDITVESTVGVGTTFTVWLPL